MTALLLLACLSSWSSLDGDGDGTSFLQGDCNDQDADWGPHAVEIWYDGLDQNCDGASDYDADGDGFDSAAYGGDDCDDERASDNPNAQEHWYDGRDQDCADDDDFDADRDGFPLSVDCDDHDVGVNPDASETWYDGIDQDCDHRSDYDVDGDGFLAEAYGGRDCKDSDPAVHPGAEDTWYDCEDSDCDGNDGDRDGDGFVPTDYACEWTLFVAHVGPGDCWDDKDVVPVGFNAINGAPQPKPEQVGPGAEDAPYDGVDADCAGRGQEFDADGDGHDSASVPDRSGATGTDCDDQDPSVDFLIWYRDNDNDGYGDPDYSAQDCTSPAGTWLLSAGDCNDQDASISPSGSEVCGGEDEDCDGTVDEASAIDAPQWFADSDGDGFGDSSVVQAACEAPSGTVANPWDCDDTDDAIHPDAVEVCDSADVDEDCNGLADDHDRLATERTDFWPDDDGDGYGDGDQDPLALCDAISGFSEEPGDCDDGDATVSPAATEDCGTTVDEDCDDIVNDGCYGGGELVITELQHDPLGPEPQGQYLEVYNTTGADLYCDGLTITVGGTEFVIAPDGLVVPTRDYAVLCQDDAVLGSACDVVYGSDVNGASQAGATWSASIDLDPVGTVELSVDGTTLDSVSWSDTGSWPSPIEGRALEVGANATTETDNDDGANWCLATLSYSGSELGSPGQSPSCTP